jgi:hypothetical protein
MARIYTKCTLDLDATEALTLAQLTLKFLVTRIRYRATRLL